MQIQYDKLVQTGALFIPLKYRKSFRHWGRKFVIRQSLKNNLKNLKPVIKKLREKLKRKEKLNVIFINYDESKWKLQCLYDFMEKSENFIPHVFVTRSSATPRDFDYQPPEKVLDVYNFFKNKNMRVQLAYDLEKKEYLSLEDMNPKPDIIIYAHPWTIAKSQGPTKMSHYAICAYVPYFVATSQSYIEYNLPFHNEIQKHYVINASLKNEYSKKADNGGKNMIVAGHPTLDYFYINKDKKFEDKNYVIYAPHFSVTPKTILKWGTFLKNGDFMLEFAKNHPEFNWIFKPHPCLKGFLKLDVGWSEEKINNYWNSWAEIGRVYETGDYLDLFMESKMLITDCGSFKIEYFLAQKPQVFLKSSVCDVKYHTYVDKINSTSYKAENIDELNEILNEVLIKGNDYKKEERKRVLQELKMHDNYCAENIAKDLLKTIL